MITETITKGIDYIPLVIAWFREFVVKITGFLNLPTDSSMLIFLGIALVLSYYWIKQFITYSVFYKLSSILNWLLIALLIFILFTYV